MKDEQDDEEEPKKPKDRNKVREQKIARFQENKQLESAIKVDICVNKTRYFCYAFNTVNVLRLFSQKENMYIFLRDNLLCRFKII